jgi:hypothetical protein
MSNYIKTTDFAIKDTYANGDPRKTAKGADVDTEFNNIATAIATKQDVSELGIAGGYAALDGSAKIPLANLPSFVQPSTTNVLTFASLVTSNQYPVGIQAAGGGYFGIDDTSGATDAKRWDIGATTSSFLIRYLNDAGTTVKNILAATRSGDTVSNITIGNAVDNPTYNFVGTGAISGNGSGLTSLNANNLSAGLVPTAQISVGSVTQWQTSLSIGWGQVTGTSNVYHGTSGSALITISASAPSGGSDGDLWFQI